MRRFRLLSRLYRWTQNRRGNVAIVFGFALPVLVGAAGLGVETSYWYYRHQVLQAAANQAAYGGALERRAGSSVDTVRSAALQLAGSNGFDTVNGTLTLNTPPTSGSHQNNQAVEVLLSEPEQRFFSRIFSTDPVIARARAVAAFQTASNACVLALDPSASRAANFSGSSGLTLNGCSVMANSTASDAINVQGAANLSADCLISAGGVQANSGMHLSTCSAPITSAPPVADPYAGLSAPADSGSCKPSNGATLQPGRYCNGLSLSGNVTLNPGVYVIDGDFRVNANANISGSGVTIYITQNGRVNMNGNATVNLTAPTSGTYAGMLFFGDRSNNGGINNFNGTASSHMTGSVYFANQEIDYLGNFSGLNGCVQVVGRTVQWTGNTSVSTDCSAYGIQNIPAQQLIALVE
jgi:hypothetical protein